jgi:hypothetical protein
MTFRVPEKFRMTKGPFATSKAHGCNGLFFVPAARPDVLRVIVSDGEGWEHASVSLPHRCPTWKEMSLVKSLFWDDEDCVMQLHPPRSDWINNHSFCLHMWRPIGVEIPRPPALMVGIKEAGVLK